MVKGKVDHDYFYSGRMNNLTQFYHSESAGIKKRHSLFASSPA